MQIEFTFTRLFASLMFGVVGLLFTLPLGASEQPILITLTLDEKNFIPVHGEVPFSTPFNGGELRVEKPPEISKEPQYEGAQRRYGYMLLGNRPNKRFNFAIDEIAPNNMRMYFDFNQNGNLADDISGGLKDRGGRNAGEPGFATWIEIPWQDLGFTNAFPGKFEIWYFINASMFNKSGFSHYSRTQLKGSVDLNGTVVPVVIADTSLTDNDADLSNDGIFLKLGGSKYRHITDGEAKTGVEIDGKTYTFHIQYSEKINLRHPGEIDLVDFDLR